VRINSHASQQYQKNAVAERSRESKHIEPQASVKTTSFGFRLGKFGVDFESQSTVLDPSLSRDVREKRKQAQAFNVEREVETLRAKVGAEGATHRDQTGPSSSDVRQPALHQIKSALAAYTRSTEDILPPPGNMLTSVV